MLWSVNFILFWIKLGAIYYVVALALFPVGLNDSWDNTFHKTLYPYTKTHENMTME